MRSVDIILNYGSRLTPHALQILPFRLIEYTIFLIKKTVNTSLCFQFTWQVIMMKGVANQSWSNT